MSKQIYVDPVEKRKPGKIKFADITVNKYQKTVKDELKNYSKEDFMNIFRDMCYVREFETMLQLIKTTGEYMGTAYNHPGPAHLGIGQEAAYVGQAWNLTIDDYSFGSHRSHGEILARGLRAVETLPEAKLREIMNSFDGGKIMKVLGDNADVRELGRNFLLYGMIAETFGRENGFNRGLGGSMHAFFTPFGIYPNNAIVGGSGPIAPGAALYKLSNRKDGVVVCNIGDAATACGPVWEGLVFSAMDQIRQLWDKEFKGMPIIFNIWNNSYGMGGQTCGETMGYGNPARIGAGLLPNEMHTETVDGLNPLAVIDAYNRKKAIAEEEGPVMLEVITYRISGHSPSDSSSYRTKEEIEAWEAQDSILAFGKQMVEAGVATQAELDACRAKVAEDMHRNMLLGIDEKVSPRLDVFGKDPNAIANLMFSNGNVKSMDATGRKADVNMPYEESPRAIQMAKKIRYGLKEDGTAVSKNQVYQMRDALAEPILHKFYEDPTLIAFGEDVRDWGGAYAVYRGFTETIPYHRFFNAPIAEAAIIGAGIGYAMAGGRAVVEIMYADFLGRCGDELFNQLSKWQSMSAGVLKMPVVVRMSVGSKYGAQHSQDWSALCGHIPGLKVVFPATPYDAKGLMQAALNGTDPVIFFESQRIYDIGELFHEGGVPAEEYEIKMGEPDVKRAGSDVTILSIGATLYRAIKAADILKEKYNVSAEVIDARSLVPFDYSKVIESVKKTGRIVITGDACERNSFMRTFASNITELAFDYLDAPPVVVGSKNWITPAHELENCFFPQPEWIVDAIHERIMPLAGHVCTHNCTELEQIRENAAGI